MTSDFPEGSTDIVEVNSDSPVTPSTNNNKKKDTSTFLQRLNKMKVILVIMFMIGFVAATPSSIIPELQQNTWGNNSFVVTGGFSAGKGALGCVVIPLYGSLSDTVGRKTALVVAESLTVLPYAIFLVTNSYWAYTVGDMTLGFHDGTMTLLLAAVADQFPQRSGNQLDSFSLAVASFFLGISIAPFLGAFLNPNPTFAVCAGMMLATVLFTVFFFENDDKRKKKQNGNNASINNHGGQGQEGGAIDASAPLLIGGSASATSTNTNHGTIVAIPNPEEEQQISQNGEGEGEDHSDDNDSTFDDAQPLLKKKHHVARLWEALVSSPDLRIVVIIIFANGLAENVLDSLLLLYFDNTLNFTATEQSIVIAILGVGSVLGLVLVNGLLRIKLGSLGTLRVELVANVVICALYSFVTVHWGIFLTTTLSIVGMGVFPCACAIAAMCLRDEAAGLAQGIASAARMASGGVGPLAFGFIFNATENGSFPGLPFLVASICVLIGFILTRFLTPRFFSKSL